jgi:hypothetical protein
MPAATASDLRKLTLNAPPLWEHDWQGAINAASGADKLLVNIEGRAAHLLKRISDPSVTFERLAWISLWTKAFSILEGTRAAVAQNSQYLLELLARTSFELVLHAQTVSESEPIERLRAYAAWCLWNDQKFQTEFLDPRTLKGIWNPEPAKAIVEDPKQREVYEKLFGELDAEIDPKKLQKGRMLQETQERFRLQRLENWLNHPDLSRWRERLQDLSRRNNRQVAFFALFNESETSVAQRLRSSNIRFLYVTYAKASLFVHGSTLEHTFVMHENALTPFFTGDKNSVAADAETIAHVCNTALACLWSVLPKLWAEAQ